LTKTVNYWASRVPFAQFIFGLSLPLILWVGGREVIQGQMPIGDLAKVVFYLMAIGHRVGAVGQFTNILQNASASAERVLEVIHEPQLIKSGKRDLPEPAKFEDYLPSRAAVPAAQPGVSPANINSETPGRTGETPVPLAGEVQFEDVSFNYTDGKASLSGVSFMAEP